MNDIPDLGEGISTAVLNNEGKKWQGRLRADGGLDIEKLISLFGASGLQEHADLAERMRRNYFTAIRSRLTAARLVDEPELAITLLEIHSDSILRKRVEVLTGILTTNHDGLLQVASQTVHGELNLGFPFFSASDFTAVTSSHTPLLLQLHGSFTWQHSIPISVHRLRSKTTYLPDTVWIPPTILKESKLYPFNKLAGMAYELLSKRCDVLRIVGSSLTQNDWNILSLIFAAQRHAELHKRPVFRVELIMSHDRGEQIKKDCSYLRNLVSIGYLTDGQFADYKEDKTAWHPDMKNAFAYWLREKIGHHRSRSELGDKLSPRVQRVLGEI